jgi:hypothetical protein
MKVTLYFVLIAVALAVALIPASRVKIRPPDGIVVELDSPGHGMLLSTYRARFCVPFLTCWHPFPFGDKWIMGRSVRADPFQEQKATLHSRLWSLGAYALQEAEIIVSRQPLKDPFANQGGNPDAVVIRLVLSSAPARFPELEARRLSAVDGVVSAEAALGSKSNERDFAVDPRATRRIRLKVTGL